METLKKILLIGLGVTFILSAILKTISVYSFSQTVNSFCGLLGMDVLYGYGFPLAIAIIAFELLIGVCAFIRRLQRIYLIHTYTWQKLKYGQCLLLVLFLSSCHNELDNALELISNNREEFEKVLRIYK